jgi:hypothetical protein
MEKFFRMWGCLRDYPDLGTCKSPRWDTICDDSGTGGRHMFVRVDSGEIEHLSPLRSRISFPVEHIPHVI